MNKPLSALWAALLLCPASAFASNCPAKDQSVGAVRAQSGALSDGICSVSVTPAEVGDLVYRDYLFTSDGELMVFNSVEGPENTSTGARSYFFFPRRGIPTFTVNGNGVQVSSATGQSFSFSASTAHLAAAPGIAFHEDPNISMSNQGGLVITGAPVLWLDGGWKVGSEAVGDPNLSSVFHDAAGRSCKVTNSEIFAYGSSGDATLKYATDAALKPFLAERCPGLDVSALD